MGRAFSIECCTNFSNSASSADVILVSEIMKFRRLPGTRNSTRTGGVSGLKPVSSRSALMKRIASKSGSVTHACLSSEMIPCCLGSFHLPLCSDVRAPRYGLPAKAVRPPLALVPQVQRSHAKAYGHERIEGNGQEHDPP